MLTDSSRFCASSHASSGLKNSNNGSADNRDVLPRVITFINCDAGSEAPFCMKSLEWKFEILSSAGHELNIFHPSIFQRRHDVKWKSRSIRTLIADPPLEIDKSRMCVMVRRDLLPGTVRRRFETGGRWRRNIWCSPDPIWCGTWRRHRNASWSARAAELSPGSVAAGPTSERSCRPVPSRTRTNATAREKKSNIDESKWFTCERLLFTFSTDNEKAMKGNLSRATFNKYSILIMELPLAAEMGDDRRPIFCRWTGPPTFRPIACATAYRGKRNEVKRSFSIELNFKRFGCF